MNYTPAISTTSLEQAVHPSKRPRTVLSNEDGSHPCTIFAFPPNRHTLGGTSYFIVDEVNILVDSPAWGDETLTFLKEYGGVDWLFLTHRDGISQVAAIQQTFGCRVLIQEQEAYLLPDATPTTFEQAFQITESCETIWTPGHSPGSACLYYDRFGGVLFSGRHLLPTPQGELLPQKTAKTFHWGRQIRSVQSLQKQFNPQTLQWICPGANTGFLRGSYAVGEAYEKLLKMATVPPQG